MAVVKLIPTQFVVQLDAVSHSRKIVNVELNLEVELELAQEPEPGQEPVQEQEPELLSNTQDLDLPLLR
jgi:hypothetical protein